MVHRVYKENVSTNTNAVEMAGNIESIIKSIFPKSYVKARFSTNIEPAITVRFTLGDGEKEWGNGYYDNDIMLHTFLIYGFDKNGNTLPSMEMRGGGNIMIKPIENKYLAYERIKTGWKNLKANATSEKIITQIEKYFINLKKIMIDNVDKLYPKDAELVKQKYL